MSDVQMSHALFRSTFSSLRIHPRWGCHIQPVHEQRGKGRQLVRNFQKYLWMPVTRNPWSSQRVAPLHHHSIISHLNSHLISLVVPCFVLTFIEAHLRSHLCSPAMWLGKPSGAVLGRCCARDELPRETKRSNDSNRTALHCNTWH